MSPSASKFDFPIYLSPRVSFETARYAGTDAHRVVRSRPGPLTHKKGYYSHQLSLHTDKFNLLKILCRKPIYIFTWLNLLRNLKNLVYFRIFSGCR
ncbi:hypothetical protein GQ457_08G007120 [Hibiscus cannabinus]